MMLTRTLEIAFVVLLFIAIHLLIVGCAPMSDRLNPNPPMCEAVGKDCR